MDHFAGDSDYTGKEIFVDATTGAVGGGLVGPVMRVGSRANKVIRHSGRQGYKVGAGATESILLAGYVTKPMISRPARMELLAGSVAGLVYDIAYSPSSEPSSERNATNVGSGGTSLGKKMYPLPKDSKGILSRTGRVLHNPCAKGYIPRRINGKLMCVKR